MEEVVSQEPHPTRVITIAQLPNGQMRIDACLSVNNKAWVYDAFFKAMDIINKHYEAKEKVKVIKHNRIMDFVRFEK